MTLNTLLSGAGMARHTLGLDLSIMPATDLPGWRLIFADDFNYTYPIGSVDALSSGELKTTAAAYTELHDKFTFYPDTWNTTHGEKTYALTAGEPGYPGNITVHSKYYPTKTISFGNSCARIWQHTEDIGGVLTALGATIKPKLPSGSYMLGPYGRWSFRMRSRAVIVGGVDIAAANNFTTSPDTYFHWVPLGIDSGNWPSNGELDWPEGSINRSVRGNYHPAAATNQTYPVSSGESPYQWNVFTVEWSPGRMKWFTNNTIRLNTTDRVPTAPQAFLFQHESDWRQPVGEGLVEIDWVCMWDYDAPGITVSDRRTTGDQASLFAAQTDITRTTYTGSPGTRPVTIDPAVQYQSMVGFGAAITDAASSVIWQMPSTQRTALMNDLFSTAGCGLSFMRLPMGASDFARSEYTYDDNGGTADPTLAAFSIAPDLTYTVPLIQAALAINPGLRIIACPWSPPAWMKTPAALHGGSMNTTYYPALAQYFVKFVQAYAALGIPIWGVTPQNEPENSTGAYPSMLMTAAQQVTFIGTHLGPAFAAAGLSTTIIAFDHNWDNTAYAQTVFASSVAGPYTSGVAWHAYLGTVDAQSTVHTAYPAKDTYFTEITASFPGNFGEDLKWHMREIDLGSPNNWARGVIYWNLALDAANGPINGGYTTGMGLVRVNADNTVNRFAPYYAKRHMSVVRPGAVRVSATTYGAGFITTSAYVNPDGSRVLVAVCDAGAAQTFKVIEAGLEFGVTMQPGDVRTFRWTGPPL